VIAMGMPRLGKAPKNVRVSCMIPPEQNFFINETTAGKNTGKMFERNF
jgi:hypothetical protein